MATIEELRDALRDTLDRRGVLDQLKATIRSEIYDSLEGQGASAHKRPTLSKENLLINELVREYLEYNRYNHTNGVFVHEAGQPKDPMEREFLATELNIQEDTSSRSVPLLYGILSYFQAGSKASIATGEALAAPPITKHTGLENSRDGEVLLIHGA